MNEFFANVPKASASIMEGLRLETEANLQLSVRETLKKLKRELVRSYGSEMEAFCSEASGCVDNKKLVEKHEAVKAARLSAYNSRCESVYSEHVGEFYAKTKEKIDAKFKAIDADNRNRRMQREKARQQQQIEAMRGENTRMKEAEEHNEHLVQSCLRGYHSDMADFCAGRTYKATHEIEAQHRYLKPRALFCFDERKKSLAHDVLRMCRSSLESRIERSYSEFVAANDLKIDGSNHRVADQCYKFYSENTRPGSDVSKKRLAALRCKCLEDFEKLTVEAVGVDVVSKHRITLERLIQQLDMQIYHEKKGRCCF